MNEKVRFVVQSALIANSDPSLPDCYSVGRTQGSQSVLTGLPVLILDRPGRVASSYRYI